MTSKEWLKKSDWVSYEENTEQIKLFELKGVMKRDIKIELITANRITPEGNKIKEYHFFQYWGEFIIKHKEYTKKQSGLKAFTRKENELKKYCC